MFPDRYHAEIITSPTQARHALKYVLSNWRKHGEDRSATTRGWRIDWFSSAAMFPDWTEYGDQACLWRWPPTYEPLWVYLPGTWLLLEGARGDHLVPRGSLGEPVSAAGARVLPAA